MKWIHFVYFEKRGRINPELIQTMRLKQFIKNNYIIHKSQVINLIYRFTNFFFVLTTLFIEYVIIVIWVLFKYHFLENQKIKNKTLLRHNNNKKNYCFF